jgi:hypothetical protein
MLPKVKSALGWNIMQNQTTTYKFVDPVSPILFTAFSLILVAYPQLPT